MEDTSITERIKAAEYSNKTVHRYIYELLSILTDEWFNDIELFKIIICMIRNHLMTQNMRVGTLSKLLLERSQTIDINSLETLMDTQMPPKQRRVSVDVMIRRIKEIDPDELSLFRKRWRHNTNQLFYEEGALTPMSVIKAVCKNITEKSVAAMNPSFEIVRMAVCKSCKKKHKVGCCKDYGRTNKTTAAFVRNAAVS